jgi:hypothetical protein
MNTPEPVVVGRGRYRIHHLRNGVHSCCQVEWQREFDTLTRQHLRCRDGTLLTFLSAPPWESSAQLFSDATAAAVFAEAVLGAAPTTSGGDSSLRT